MLNSRTNNTNDKNWTYNQKRGGEPYEPPVGWQKYGIRVYSKYDNKNNDWLSSDNRPSEWSIAYSCFLGNTNKKNEKNYENENDIKHSGKKVGKGVICYNNPKILEKEAEVIKVNSLKYKIGFMIRVNPSKIRCPEKNKEIWILNGTPDEIRPYGILIKKAK